MVFARLAICFRDLEGKILFGNELCLSTTEVVLVVAPQRPRSGRGAAAAAAAIKTGWAVCLWAGGSSGFSLRHGGCVSQSFAVSCSVFQGTERSLEAMPGRMPLLQVVVQ